MSILSKGIAWLEGIRNSKMVEETSVFVLGEEANAFPLPATVESSTSVTYQNGVKIQTTYFHFIYVTASFLETQLPIDRGLQIRRLDFPDKIYELAIKGKEMYKYNDPDHKAIILYCVEKNVS